jgi:hypothetical protein
MLVWRWFRSSAHPHIYNGTGHVAFFNLMQIVAFYAGGAMKEIGFVNVKVGAIAGVKEHNILP